MKRLVSLLLIITVVLLFLFSGWFSVETRANEGYWKLDGVTVDKNEDSERTTMTVEQGYATYITKDENSGDVFAASGSWTPPDDEYRGGDTITLTLTASVETYVWNGQPNSGHLGLNFMGYSVSARLDAPDVPFGFAGNNSIHLIDAEKKNAADVSATEGTIHQQSRTREVSAEFRAGYRDGDRLCLYVSASHTGHVAYCYVWIDQSSETSETTPPSQTADNEDGKKIWVSGIVTDVEFRVMPHMKVTINFYNDAAAHTSGGPPTHQIITHTDLEGRFFHEFVIPADHEKTIGIEIKGTLTCILGTDEEAYRFTNMAYEQAREDISLASFITVDPTARQHRNSNPIHVARMFSFFYLVSGTWSYEPQTQSFDPLWSNVPDHFKLVAASYLYGLVWDAQFYGAVILGEAASLRPAKLKIETDWTRPAGSRMTDNSHFYLGGGGNNIIRLTPAHSRFNDQSRFTILHEYGHYFDATTNGGQFRAISLLPAGATSVNHGGYMNSSTADSFEEALASAFALFVQTYRKDPLPHIGGGYDFGTPGNYVAWRANGKEEELAIVALLYKMYGQYRDKEAFWQILKPNKADFYAYYQAFEQDVTRDAAKLGILEDAARKGGLYTMPFGDGQYNQGEPFLDNTSLGFLSISGVHDPGEPFGDLMFAAGSSGWIDESQFLRTLPDTLVLGKTSDALRNRQTIHYLDNSYVHVEGLTVDQVLIRVIPDQGEAVQNLVSVEDGRIYLSLISRPLQGTVEVAVPGGDIIYSGDLAELQQQLRETMGQAVPLAEVTVAGLVQPDTTLWPVPSYGDPDRQVVLDPPDLRQIRKNNDRAELQASDLQAAQSLAQLGDLDRQRTTWKPSRDLTAILIAGLSVLVLSALIVLIVLLVRKRRNRTHLPPAPRTEQIRPVRVFCPDCGGENEAGHSYCEHCGHRLQP